MLIFRKSFGFDRTSSHVEKLVVHLLVLLGVGFQSALRGAAELDGMPEKGGSGGQTACNLVGIAALVFSAYIARQGNA